MHVQNVPVSGRVVVSRYAPGRKVAAFRGDAGDVNQKHITVIERPAATGSAIRQIAGLVARRVVCTLKEGQAVERGQLMGLIKFGSRVDVVVPESYRVLVQAGQRVVNGADPAGRPARHGRQYRRRGAVSPPGPEERRRKLPPRLRRGAYLLPSLFTIGNMLLGFYAVVLALRSAGCSPATSSPSRRRFAGRLPGLAAAFLDALDGRIARLTGTESEFGREYDSLADVFTFGMAPALLAYLWGLKDVAPQLWIVPLFFLVCVATRLARFNVQSRVVDSRFFVGLPAPAGAGAICSLLFFAPNGGRGSPSPTPRPRARRPVLVASPLAARRALLMVSTFRYRELQEDRPAQALELPRLRC